MKARFSLSVVCSGVELDVRVNGARIVVRESQPVSMARQLAPFVVAGLNTVVLEAKCVRPLGGRVRARVLERRDGGWVPVAEMSKELQHGDAGVHESLSFVSPPDGWMSGRTTRCEALGPGDRDAIRALLEAVHRAVSQREGQSVLPLFSHWIEHYARLHGVADDTVVERLLDVLDALGDPELALAPLGQPELELVCGGGLCVATDASGRTPLRAETEGGAVQLSLVFGKVEGAWAIIA